MVAELVSQQRTSPIGQAPGTTSWQQRFLQLLPRIRAQAQHSFRHLAPEAREDATAEVIASSLVSFERLVARGREDRAYATPLARFAVARCRSGRRVGCPLNARDVSSDYCHQEAGVSLQRLDRFDARWGDWQDVVVEDRRSGPAEVAALRVDFAAWLESLSDRQRRLAERLATGERTDAAAREFGISPGRVSQLRRELHSAWQKFQGEPVRRPSEKVS